MFQGQAAPGTYTFTAPYKYVLACSFEASNCKLTYNGSGTVITTIDINSYAGQVKVRFINDVKQGDSITYQYICYIYGYN